MIRVQSEDFDVGAEMARLSAGRTDIGALSCFVGLVRDMAGDDKIGAMTLEHYPGMTEREIEKIVAEARERWPLREVAVIHRYGRLEPGERIVLVITASAHREAAIRSCEFLIDWLKTKAPFWKLEERESGAEWVEAREADDAAAGKWGEAAESNVTPLFDTTETAVDKLLARGRRRGYVTYEELNEALPPEIASAEQIEDAMARLADQGVEVLEKEDE